MQASWDLELHSMDQHQIYVMNSNTTKWNEKRKMRFNYESELYFSFFFKGLFIRNALTA